MDRFFAVVSFAKRVLRKAIHVKFSRSSRKIFPDFCLLKDSLHETEAGEKIDMVFFRAEVFAQVIGLSGLTLGGTCSKESLGDSHHLGPSFFCGRLAGLLVPTGA